VKTLIASLTVIGLVTYALLRLAYSAFYDQLSLEPEDVGLGYGVILSQSITGLVFLIVLFALVGLVVIAFTALAGIAAGLVAGLAAAIVNAGLSKLPKRLQDRLTNQTLVSPYTVGLGVLAIVGIQLSWGYGGPFTVSLLESSPLGSLLSSLISDT